MAMRLSKPIRHMKTSPDWHLDTTSPVGERWRLGVGAFVTDEMIADENRTMMLRSR